MPIDGIAYAFKIVIFRDKASGRGLGKTAQHFDFDLTYDVIGDPEVNQKFSLA